MGEQAVCDFRPLRALLPRFPRFPLRPSEFFVRARLLHGRFVAIKQQAAEKRERARSPASKIPPMEGVGGGGVRGL